MVNELGQKPNLNMVICRVYVRRRKENSRAKNEENLDSPSILVISLSKAWSFILGRSFLCTIGGVIDMKEGNIKFQFPVRNGMEHFPRTIIRPPYESIMRASYGSETKYDNT